MPTEITITNNGKLTPLDLTIDWSKTSLPLMAEASEATQTVPGSDGEIVLATTYGSRPFEINGVTDDNLSAAEKEAARQKIRSFLNSVKNTTTKLKIEPWNRTFLVKYSGLASDVNYPKYVEFNIPLKSASSYAISEDYTKTGTNTFTSKTEKEVGFKCTITGPAQYPELTMNGIEMKYNSVVASGQTLVIDTAKCTATMINSDGTKTNAMMYYNHNFPKIQNGSNTFTVVSESTTAKIDWNDLLL